jgi:hypothetical protein
MSQNDVSAQPAGGLTLFLKNIAMFVLAAVVAAVVIQVGKRVAPGLFGAAPRPHAEATRP